MTVAVDVVSLQDIPVGVSALSTTDLRTQHGERSSLRQEILLLLLILPRECAEDSRCTIWTTDLRSLLA
jgi:hypothetical protein